MIMIKRTTKSDTPLLWYDLNRKGVFVYFKPLYVPDECAGVWNSHKGIIVVITFLARYLYFFFHFFRSNLLRLEIYFEELNYAQTREVPSYEVNILFRVFRIHCLINFRSAFSWKNTIKSNSRYIPSKETHFVCLFGVDFFPKCPIRVEFSNHSQSFNSGTIS